MADSQENPNDNLIVKMKLDKDFLTFDAKHYPKKLISHISKEEWRNIAFDATQVIFDAYSYSKNQSIIIVPKWMDRISSISMIIGILCFLWIIICIKWTSGLEDLIYIAKIIIVFVIAINILLMFYNFYRVLQPQKDIAVFILKEIGPFVEDINRKYNGKAVFSFNMEKYELQCQLNSH